jgi:excisionase family DNA binding protein
MDLKENTMRCTHIEDLLPAFLEEDLSPQENLTVEEHLKGCENCQQFMARLESLDQCFEHLSSFNSQSSLDFQVGESSLMADRKVLLEQILRVSDGRVQEPHGDILTPEEVASYLKVSVAAVYEMASEMPFFYFGNDLRIRRERLVKWIDEQEFASHRKALAVVSSRL